MELSDAILLGLRLVVSIVESVQKGLSQTEILEKAHAILDDAHLIDEEVDAVARGGK